MNRITLATVDGALDLVDGRSASSADRAFRLQPEVAAARIVRATDQERSNLALLISWHPPALGALSSASASLDTFVELLFSEEIFAVVWPTTTTGSHLGGLSTGRALAALHASTRGPSSASNSTRSFYEIVVLDELETPLTGVDVLVTTPAGTTKGQTDAAGRVRIDGVPPGFGHAQIASLAQLALIMRGREQGSRRMEPLPEGEPWHVRTASQLLSSILLPDAESQQLLVLTRTDLLHSVNSNPWEVLLASDPGPWALTTDSQTRLAWHADAMGRVATIESPAPEVLDPPPAPVSLPEVSDELWIAPDVYVVQPGDTLVAIATRYLGDGARWREIWALNRDRMAGRSPDRIFPGDAFVMPTAAVPTWAPLPVSEPSGTPTATLVSPVWLQTAINGVHDALVSGAFGKAWSVLESIPLNPPALDTSPQAPFVEEVVFRETMVELALAGRVDLPAPETEQV